MNTDALRETVSALRACLRKRRDAGADDDEADDVCRNADPRTPVDKQPPKGQVGEAKLDRQSANDLRNKLYRTPTESPESYVGHLRLAHAHGEFAKEHPEGSWERKHHEKMRGFSLSAAKSSRRMSKLTADRKSRAARTEGLGNPSGSVSTGDGEGYMGTGAIVNPDPNEVAKSWSKATPAKTYEAWSEHGKRMGLSPEGVEQGWTQMMKTPENSYKEAVESLVQVFGERGDWSGYYVPTVNMMSKPGAPWLSQTAPSMNPNEYPNSQAQAGGFGFRTPSAWKVWAIAQELIILDPLLRPGDLLAKAIGKAGINNSELTPEDEQLLKMAIDWLQSGPARSDVRTGGTPGGPFRSTGSGGAP